MNIVMVPTINFTETFKMFWELSTELDFKN